MRRSAALTPARSAEGERGNSGALPRRRYAGKGVDCECGHPGAEVGINGPTAIRALGGAEEVESSQGDRMAGLSAASQAHDDETGQRRGFEEASIRRLDSLQDLEGRLAGEIPEQADNRVGRWPGVMP